MKLSFYVGLLATFFALNQDSKIVGGIEAGKNEFPFIVSLQMGTSHFCGGSLIAPKWVLTAAHCIYTNSLVARGRVVIGAHRLDDSGLEIHKIKRAIKHPRYQERSETDFDFALIELDTDSSYSPIRLNGGESEIVDLDGRISTTAGWGATFEGGNVSKVLMKVDVDLLTQEQCEKAYPKKIFDTMICAGFDDGGRDSCQGDSGGAETLNVQGRNITLQTATAVGSVPMHPGALRYFREKGVAK
ncbi:MAG: serine protease [Bacteroidetes bacterium]|nr:serine protease [Bacteroidota bacterium]